MSEELIPEDELEDALKRCPEWEVEGDLITRAIDFEEFSEAIDFVNELAEMADDAQHYPVIEIAETKVSLFLKTEDAGGVTEIDLEFASRVDNLVD
ncbi:4a-hydroxytetrahydrobiopterin dehydratase [Persicirhabdus sediminis]|uniref:4a-hydroxytetrahydrobiopterin dehydratase n=1 Tax=Persicirhabdus sediminis TaxID=454144 RepID=A0A8J7SK30_9BACT|nr:4a-hydroxytetrahydrobiopterin dehydratase [Persicirhabdus sediminis]MBK1789543.1 4a-hydroxytetrahydrobiopterin dehydratase [Persicirhabdus sediminis]